MAQVEPGLPLVKADPLQIAQVLQNLLLNARQAMPGGGTIDLRAENAVVGPGEGIRYPAGVEALEEPTPEPEVTIVDRERDTVYEYRINGRLYMIKVVPQVGPPYYFIDQDGDGNMETRATDYTLLRIPQWVLATW